MSSISQMERSSSQTRILPTCASSDRCHSAGAVKPRLLLGASCRGGHSLSRREASQAQHKHASLPWLGTGKNLAIVSLNNLVDDGQTQAGTSLELRLEGLENFFDQLRAHARSGIGEIDLPVFSAGFKRDRQRAPGGHGAHRVFAEVPEDLLEPVTVRRGPGLFYAIFSFYSDAGILRGQTMIQQGESVFKQRQQIHLGEL